MRFRGEDDSDDSDSEPPLQPIESDVEPEADDATAAAGSAAASSTARSAASLAKERRVQRILDEFGVHGEVLQVAAIKRLIGDELGAITDKQWRDARKVAEERWSAAHAAAAPVPWKAVDTPEEEWSHRVERAIDVIYRGRHMPLPQPDDANQSLPPTLAHVRSCLGTSHVWREWRNVKSEFVSILFPGEEFDPTSDDEWKRFIKRWTCVLRAFNDGEGPLPLRRGRRDTAAAFGYTDEDGAPEPGRDGAGRCRAVRAAASMGGAVCHARARCHGGVAEGGARHRLPSARGGGGGAAPCEHLRGHLAILLGRGQQWGGQRGADGRRPGRATGRGGDHAHRAHGGVGAPEAAPPGQAATRFRASVDVG